MEYSIRLKPQTMKSKKYILLAVLLVIGYGCYKLVKRSGIFINANETENIVYVYIKPTDTPHDVAVKLSRICYGGTKPFDNLCKAGYEVKPGRYGINPDMTWVDIYRKLKKGVQDPVEVNICSERQLDKWVEQSTQNLALSHKELYRLLQDETFCQKYDCTPTSIMGLFIPGQYEMYWDCTIDEFMNDMKVAHDLFWEGKREAKCKKIGMSKDDVITLASIITQETNDAEEQAMMAGVYINRINIGMCLQSCPTAIYANQAWGVNRVTDAMTRKDSPYNTYIYKGLPPGPICIPTAQAIDAVLGYKKHDYIYFCAKEDFSGKHYFSATFKEHDAHAKKYQAALREWMKKKKEKEVAEAAASAQSAPQP